MCCNTKAGPRAAIAFFKKQTGIHVTQADWHSIRTCAEAALGRPLSNQIADSRLAAITAADFANSLNATPEEKREFVFMFANQRNTEGTIDAVDYLTKNGVPEDVSNKRPRVSAAQRAEEERITEMANQWAEGPSDAEIAAALGVDSPFPGARLYFVHIATATHGSIDQEIWAASRPEAISIARASMQRRGIQEDEYQITKPRHDGFDKVELAILDAGEPDTSSEELAKYAKHENASVRISVAESLNASTTTLDDLAADPNSAVRMAVAENPGTPDKAIRNLAMDRNETVAEIAREAMGRRGLEELDNRDGLNLAVARNMNVNDGGTWNGVAHIPESRLRPQNDHQPHVRTETERNCRRMLNRLGKHSSPDMNSYENLKQAKKTVGLIIGRDVTDLLSLNQQEIDAVNSAMDEFDATR